MSTSQITSISTACSTICSATDQRKHQRSTSLAFARGIHWWPVDSPHKGPVTWKIFSFDDIIMKVLFGIGYNFKLVDSCDLSLHIPQWLVSVWKHQFVFNAWALIKITPISDNFVMRCIGQNQEVNVSCHAEEAYDPWNKNSKSNFEASPGSCVYFLQADGVWCPSFRFL